MKEKLLETRNILYEGNYKKVDRNLDEITENATPGSREQLDTRLLRIQSLNGLFGRGRFNEILEPIESLLRDNSIERYHEVKIDALLEKVEFLYWTGKFQEMFEVNEQIRNVLKKLDKNTPSYKLRKGRMQFWEGYAQWYQKGAIGTKEIFEEARTAFKESDSKIWQAMVHIPLGIQHLIQGKPEKAKEYFDSSKKKFKESNHYIGIRQAKIYQGIHHRVQGKHSEAIKLHKETLKDLESIEHKLFQSFNLQQIGFDYQAKGEPRNAIDYFERSIDISRELEINVWIAGSLGGLSNNYNQLGKYEVALDYARQNLEIVKNQENKSIIAWSHNRIANIHNRMGNMNEGMSEAEKAKKIFSSLDHKIGIAAANSAIGYSEILLGNLEDASKHVEKAIDIQSEHNMLFPLSETYLLKGRIEFEQANYREAEKLISKSIEIREENKFWTDALASSYFHMLRLQLVKQNEDQAEKYLKKLEEINEVTESNRINQHTRLGHAMILSRSKEDKDRLEALKIMRKIRDEEPVDHEIKTILSIELSRGLINNVAVKPDDSQLAEILTYIGGLESMAKEQESELLYAETYGLQGSLARAENKPEQTRSYFTKAKDIVDKNQYGRLSETYHFDKEKL